MLRLPIDTARLTLVCAGEGQPVLDYTTRQPRTDRNGVPLYQVTCLATTDDGFSDVIAIKVPGQPQGLTGGTTVQAADLTGTPYEIDDRSGIAFRATTIRPLNSSTATGTGREKGASQS